MKIEGKGPGPTPADRVPSVTARDAADPSRKPASDEKRGDRVEISAAARALSGEAGESGAVAPVPALAPDRLQQVAERVRSGFYETDEVQVAVARQIVAQGAHRS